MPREFRSLLALAALSIGTLAARPSVPHPAGAKTSAAAAGFGLQRISHEPNLLSDRGNSAFGTLLFDARGRLALHDGHKTWLYTSAVLEPPAGSQRDWYGKWITHVREFDIDGGRAGERRLALDVADGERWAIVHDVIQVNEHLYAAFYSAFGGVRAALSDRPEGPFLHVPGFEIRVTDAWERAGGPPESLESNGAHVLIAEDAQTMTLWLGYDSYHVDSGSGQLGWAKVAIDVRARAIKLVGKHPGNPLALLPPNELAARCGGNLSSDVRLAGRHVLMYYTRPERARSFLTLALADDPLFQTIAARVELEPTLGDERVAEKFESYTRGGLLYVIYENQLADGHWGTGLRVYRIAR